MPKCILILLLLLVAGQTAFSQNEIAPADPRVIQISGLIVTGDSLTPVPLTTIYRQRDMRGTVCDMVGFFSMPVLAGDTIVFSNIGYVTARYVIPENLEDNRLSIVQFLKVDTVVLETAEVHPWPHPSRFKQEFLAMDDSNSEYVKTQQNLNDIAMYDGMFSIGADGQENYRRAIQEQADRMYYNGQANPINLLNPIAWAQFLKSWRNGDLRRQ